MKPRAPLHPWLMLGPTLALLVVFFLLPIAVSAYESFFSWDLLTPPRYVALGNYRYLATRGDLLGIALRTTAYSVLVVSGTMTAGLSLALIVRRPGRLFAFVRASVFSAYVVSWVAVALLWTWLLDGNAGVVGWAMRRLGATPWPLLGDPRWVLPTLALVGVWKLTGYAMIVFLAGLHSVPQALIEAAALDGAGPWRRFRHVTLPILAPTTAFVATTSLVTSFQAFDVVRIMTQGGPGRSTELFVYAIYEQIFLDLSVGRASALTVVFFVVLLLLAGLELRVWRGRARPEAPADGRRLGTSGPVGP